MTVHFHGTPITPRGVMYTLGGSNFCISHTSPEDLKVCLEIGQLNMIDNGAYSKWKSGKETDWNKYYRFLEPILEYKTVMFAVIPDVIVGDESMNDSLILEWPYGQRGTPVWHMHESIDRFIRLCDDWRYVCIGSSGQYSEVGSDRWRGRMDDAFNKLHKFNTNTSTWIHMLRGMQCCNQRVFDYPFDSVDSTDVARNHHRPGNNAKQMADRWNSMQCVHKWRVKPTQSQLF